MDGRELKNQNHKTLQKECWINLKSLVLSVVQADCFSESVLLRQASTWSLGLPKNYDFSDINASYSKKKKSKLRIFENLDLNITNEKKQHIKNKENGPTFPDILIHNIILFMEEHD